MGNAKNFQTISKISEKEDYSTSAIDLLVQQSTTITEVTRVKLNQTDDGLQVILETATGQRLVPLILSQGNSLVIDILDATLALPTKDEFRETNPAPGIREVTVTEINNRSIRVTITGEQQAPSAEVVPNRQDLVLSVTPEGTTADTEPDEEIDVIATGEGGESYYVPDASTATRTDTPIRDIPQSIQVVPRQVIEDQKASRLREALRNVSGVSEAGNFGGAIDSFNIRGFATFNTLRDGFKIGQGGLRETANLERIEVLKGPASVLYGNLEPGGVINLVTKKPLSEPYYFAEFQAGNYQSYRGSIDISGPGYPDKSALYRLNAVYENSDTFREPIDRRTERFFIAPVLAWNIGENTDLTFELDYLNVEQPFDRGSVAIGNRPADIPITRFLGDPDDVYKLEEIGVGYRFEHRFNENLTLRNAFRFQQSDTFDQKTQPGELDEETGDLPREFDSNDDRERNYAVQTDLISKFATGSIEHTLLFGFDLARNEYGGTNNGLPFAPSINIFNPVYPEVSRDLSDYTVPRRDDSNRTDTLGIFLQDQIAFTDNLKMLIGGRFDLSDRESEDRLEDSTSTQYDEAFSPRIGLVYQPIPPISLYASYSRLFAPNFATSADGSILEPERGTQYEVGIKGDLLDGRLLATLAAYQITKTNIGTTDPENPDFSIPVGEIRSRGIELDTVGEIMPGWNLIASYGYIDSEITESSDPESFPVGTKTENVAPNAASLWTTYEIQEGSLQGLGFGLGLFYADEKLGDFENTYKLPSYIRTDAAIFYKRNNWRAAVNFRNLFDIEYYESVNYGRSTIQPGTPFVVIGSFAIEF
ncbi:TonB-dependent receptor [Pleurocapsales cyanobacterium LEGE 06147]|nr:TonB-dependent receptor [Pleurocapsales cyanobacterium LEGE 06147]